MSNEPPLHYPTDQRLRYVQKRLKTWNYVWIAMSMLFLVIVFTADKRHDMGTHETRSPKCTPTPSSLPAVGADEREDATSQSQLSK